MGRSGVGHVRAGRRAKLYRITDPGRGSWLPPWRRGRGSPPGSRRCFRVMKRSLRSWLWRVPLDQEITDEIALHLELRTRELIRSGMDPRSARELALAADGRHAIVKETCVNLGRKRDRGMRLSQWFEELRDDVSLPSASCVRRQCSRRSRSRRWRWASAPTVRSSRWSTRRSCGRCLRQPGSAGHDLGDLRRELEKLRIPAEHARLEHAQPDVRADRRLHPERRRHGDGRP